MNPIILVRRSSKGRVFDSKDAPTIKVLNYPGSAAERPSSPRIIYDKHLSGDAGSDASLPLNKAAARPDSRKDRGTPERSGGPKTSPYRRSGEFRLASPIIPATKPGYGVILSGYSENPPFFPSRSPLPAGVRSFVRFYCGSETFKLLGNGKTP